MNNGKTLIGLMIILILASFGYTTWSVSELRALNRDSIATLNKVMEKFDERLDIVEGEQIRRTDYFKELLNLMNELKRQKR